MTSKFKFESGKNKLESGFPVLATDRHYRERNMPRFFNTFSKEKPDYQAIDNIDLMFTVYDIVTSITSNSSNKKVEYYNNSF